MNQGTIVQYIGAVTDIQFPREAMPKVYDALVLEESNDASFAEKGLTFEVEQQLGDGVVRWSLTRKFGSVPHGEYEIRWWW